MMWRLCLVGTAFFAVSGSNAAFSEQVNDAPTIPLPLDLREGQRKHVSYVRLISTIEGGAKKTERAIVEGAIEIISVSEDLAHAAWTTKSVTVNELSIRAEDEGAVSFLIGVPLEYHAGLDGAPIEILNQQKVLDVAFMAVLKLSDTDNEAALATKKMFETMPPGGLAQVFLKAPSFISLCQGTEFRVGQRSDFSTELPNPFGGAPLPATGYYLLISEGDDDGTAEISWRQKIDAEAGGARLVEGIQSLAKDAGGKSGAVDDIKNTPLDMTYSAECSVNRSTGWVSRMEYKVEVSLGAVQRTEIWTIDVRDDA